jgi:hypothetical protein
VAAVFEIFCRILGGLEPPMPAKLRRRLGKVDKLTETSSQPGFAVQPGVIDEQA